MRDIDGDTVVKAANEALTRPSDFGYFGDLPLFETWGFTISQCRDSDALERSNFRRIHEDVRAFLSQVTDDPDEYVQVVCCNHWMFGWVDHLAVKVLRDDSEESAETLYAGDPVKPSNITAVFKMVADIAIGLREQYPVYDESDYSELESEEDYAAFEESWSAMLRRWDDDEDGPEPTEDEKSAVDEKLHEQETPEGYDDDEMKALVHEIRGFVTRTKLFEPVWADYLARNPEMDDALGHRDDEVRSLLDSRGDEPYTVERIERLVRDDAELAAHRIHALKGFTAQAYQD